MRRLLYHAGMLGCCGAVALMAIGWLTHFGLYSIALPIIIAAVGMPVLWAGDSGADYERTQ